MMQRRQGFTRVVGLGLMTLLSSALSSRAQDYVQTYQRANQARQAGNEAVALAGFEKALDGARVEGDAKWVYYSTYRIGYIQRNQGEGEKATKSFTEALSGVLDPATGDAVPALKSNRGDVLLNGLALMKLQTERGFLGAAFQTQAQLNRLTNRWIESQTGAAYDCLASPPPIGIDGKSLAFVWRMRTSQAGLWDLSGRTVDAVALLRKSLVESPAPAAGTREDQEWQRTRQNLAVMLAFLGYRQEALTEYQALMEERPGSLNAGYARFNWARLSSRREGPSESWLAEAQKGYAEIKQLGTLTRELAELDRILGVMEADLGNTRAARERLVALKDAADARGDALIQMYVRAQLLLQDDDENDDTLQAGKEEALVALLEDYRARGVRRGEPSVYRQYAFFLADAGRYAEAVVIIRQAAKLTELFGWDLHLPRLWIAQAQWLQRLRRDSDAAKLWERVDALLTSNQDFDDKRRLEVLLARMQWLASQKRLTDAKSNYEQAATLVADSATLTSYQKRAFEALDVRPLLAAETALRGPESTSAIADLQPLAVRSVASPGLTANAVFFLSNPGIEPVEGTLSAIGPIATARWLPEETSWYIGLADSAPNGTKQSPAIVCPPGERVAIMLQHRSTKDSPVACSFEWTAKLGTKTAGNAVAGWEYGGTEMPDLTARALTASVARRNAFYAVPVPQLIQPSATEDVTRDFRLLASSSCWMEITDDKGNPLAVDANGNGAFDDRGDWVAYDQNTNGLPDLTLKADPKHVPHLIIFNVYPPDDGKTIDLLFQLRNAGGQWETQSMSQLQ